jgi:hypothetical protein
VRARRRYRGAHQRHEFTLALADMAHVDDAVRMAHKVLAALRRPFTVAGR